MTRPSAEVVVPRNVFRSISRLPIDFMYLLGQHDIDPRAYYWPQTTISVESYNRLWHTIKDLSGNPYIAQNIGGHLTPEDLELFEFQLMTSKSLLQAANKLAEHCADQRYGKFRISADENQVSIALLPMQHLPAQHDHCVLLYFVQMLRLLCSEQFEYTITHLRRSSPGLYNEKDDLIQRNRHFSAVTLPKTVLDLPLDWQDGILKKLISKGNLQDIQRLLGKTRNHERIKHAIDEALVFNDLDKPQIISQLGEELSLSTSACEAISNQFREYLDEVRKDWALRHMEQICDMRDLANIGHRLGYHRTQGQLQIDYSRWTGQSLLINTVIID